MKKKAKFNLVRLLKFRDKIYKGLTEVVDRPVDPAAFERLVSICSAHLMAERDAVERSLLEVRGKVLTPAAARQVAWRLAANKAAVRKGVAVSGGTYATYAGPAAVKVAGVRPGRRRYKDKSSKVGAYVRLEVQTGPAAGQVLDKFWSVAMCSRLARAGGACRKRAPLPDVRVLFGAHLLVRLDPLQARDGVAGFTQVGCPPTLAARNSRLRAKRSRKKFACLLRKAEGDLPCFKCPVGKDRCEAATHETTYVLKPCGFCPRRAFHETAAATKCLECETRERLER